MDTNEIKARLAEVQIEMEDLLEIRRSSSVATAIEVGTDALAGINLDNLSKWAREMRVVNTRLDDLANERRELREMKRELRTCDCNCH
jgi:hypothetical protein